MIILQNVSAVVICSLVSQVGPAVLSSRRQKEAGAGGARSAVILWRVKWSNLEQQAPDSIPPGHMLRMDLKLTAWVPIDRSQTTSMLAGEHFESAVSVPFGFKLYPYYPSNQVPVAARTSSLIRVASMERNRDITFTIHVSGLLDHVSSPPAEQANNELFPFTAIFSQRTYNPVQANKSSKTANESSFPGTKRQLPAEPPSLRVLSRSSSKFLPIGPLEPRMIARNLAGIK